MTVQQSSRRFFDDLVYLVLESDDHWWPRDLLRLAGVSRAWLGPAEKRLYACPSLCSFRACRLLARTLTDNPSKQFLLQGLDLRPSIGFGVDDGSLSAAEMSSLRFLLSLDNLRLLTLGGELAVQAERFLHSMTYPDAVNELRVDGMTHSAGHNYLRCRKPASLEWDEVMAFKFTNLQKLSLSNLELDILYPSTPSFRDVEDLHLDSVDISCGHLSHLFHESWSSLKHLSVTAKSASEFNEHLVLTLACCSQLETLRYEVIDGRSDLLLFDENTFSLPTLRRLSLSGLDINSQTLLYMQQICSGLEELTVTGRAVRVTPNGWSSFLSSGALPLLQTLSISWGTCHPPFEHWSPDASIPLMSASADRKINLTHPANLSSRF